MGLDAKVIRPEDNMIVNHGVLLGLVAIVGGYFISSWALRHPNSSICSCEVLPRSSGGSGLG
jgi:hypothetical protein